jgi:hypothetical protein
LPKRNQEQIIKESLGLLVARCPRLVKMCYWAGTAALSIEELQHRGSFDLDFHTHHALADVRPILAEIQAVFGDDFEIVQAPDAFGSGFRGVLRLPDGEQITVEILSNYEDVPAEDLVRSSTAPKIQRASVARYLADKIQCVAERTEARDLVDLLAVLRRYPRLESNARRALAQQDALIVVERLLAWTDEEIGRDLAAYPDVEPADAIEARDLLLGWIKETGAGEPTG